MNGTSRLWIKFLAEKKVEPYKNRPCMSKYPLKLNPSSVRNLIANGYAYPKLNPKSWIEDKPMSFSS
jgi:hypothetical protein